MTLFLVTHWKLELINKSNPKEGVRMVIVLKRKIMSEMLVTYFPSVLLMAITFATTFFKPFFFEAGLSVNLTTMLVMTTIFISVMEKLPLTSYPKMIDFWLIFCQVGKVFFSLNLISPSLCLLLRSYYSLRWSTVVRVSSMDSIFIQNQIKSNPLSTSRLEQ